MVPRNTRNKTEFVISIPVIRDLNIRDVICGLNLQLNFVGGDILSLTTRCFCYYRQAGNFYSSLDIWQCFIKKLRLGRIRWNKKHFPYPFGLSSDKLNFICRNELNKGVNSRLLHNVMICFQESFKVFVHFFLSEQLCCRSAVD